MPSLYRPLTTVDGVQEATQPGAIENLYLEFKGDLEKKDNAKTESALDIAAFANQWGVTIVFGVREKGADYEIIGVADFDKTREHIEESRKGRVWPTPDIEINRLVFGGKVVVAVNVSPDECLIAVQDGDALKYPFRTNKGRSYMRADQVIERINAPRCGSQLALHRAAKAVVKVLTPLDEETFEVPSCPVTVASRVVRYESGYQNNPIAFEAQGQLTLLGPHHFVVKLICGKTSQDLPLPYGVLREAWVHDSRVQLMLLGSLAFNANNQWLLEG